MTPTSRRIAAASFLLAAGLLAIDSAAWWWLSGQVMAQYAAWADQQRAHSLLVTSDPPRRAGWPFAAAVIVPRLTLATSASPAADALAWHCTALRLLFQPWRPGVFTAIPTGPQQLQLGSAGPVGVIAQALSAAIPLQPSDRTITTVQAHGLAATWRGQRVAVERLHLRFDTLDLDLAADTIALPRPPPGQPALPFGGIMEALGLHAHLTVAWPAAAEWGQALRRWQRAGGELQLTSVALRWGPLDAHGSATGHLTAGLQPEATGRLDLTGYDETIQALQRSGTLSADAARVATAVFSLLAHDRPGAAPDVDLPLSLANGLLSAGPIPLFRVPPLTLAEQLNRPAMTK